MCHVQVPSSKRPTDPCTIVKRELGLDTVPSLASSKFPTGVQVCSTIYLDIYQIQRITFYFILT